MKPAEIDNLAVSRYLEHYEQEKLIPHEVVVRIVDAGLYDPEISSFASTLLRTAAVFVLPYADVSALMTSGAFVAGDPLPRLPHTRVLFEWIESWDAVERPRIVDTDGVVHALDAIGVVERVAGDYWDICLYLGDPDEPGKPQATRRFECRYQDGTYALTQLTEHSDSAHDVVAQAATIELSITIVAAYAVDIVGGRHTPIFLSRAERRRHERRFGVRAPMIYRVDLAGAGDQKEGVSDRLYTCRWLVRGHWRHLPDGSKTWVRSYVKGPAGAPWKGKPIHVAA